ncbi:Dihydrolipoyllysine-residue acetyltransferase component of pyruvate dehydrogenase complex [Magnetospirillum sp. LM-5]|uniref:pyruvate dehydrogenase complex dihydrolipoamide acetyltransferase n=1 Tax=Magnetospirillum sp. LM-5 TaxID=2681466 RepID=UPI00137EFBBE|nr:pyruvate dehydrogenase complex dihydrolipoamide acetyltransferase [Magnetospirillum sp. LM-5]CAA7613806.1 Dihydrolipoyllysine-residue acetyltransferase component of pyruvate dehydrogenase complex [Magnetospirillum sp. LM-5]
MPIEILMPALSPTMTEGTLARWLKAEGDAVKSGDVLAEIETDKATMEFEAVDEGVLGKIVVPAGTSGVAVNTLIGVILAEGESAADIKAGAPKAAAAPAAAVPTAAAPAAAAPVAAAAHSGPRVFASPLAKRIAADAGIDLKAVAGSGPYGRIVKADVEKAKAGGTAKPAPVAASAPAAAAPKPAPVPAAANPFEPAFEEIPNSTMRKVIARRLTEAKATIPHFYLSIDCELDALLKVRSELNGRSDAYKLSVNDFVIRAVALALKKVPAANASWGEDAIKRYTDVDVSVAVATPAGLITPIIRHADHKGLASISAEMKELAGKAKDNKLKPEEFQGGGFTISNLGMYGVKDFAAIINPPQGAILAVGAGLQRPVVKAGALAIATVMTCTLSVDHRVIDGAVGAEFLAAFKKLIEDPLSMLL